MAALGEADAVDGGGFGEDGVGGEVGADAVDLKSEVAEEGCGAVGGGVGVEADVVGCCVADGVVYETAQGAEAVCFVAGSCQYVCG